MPRPIPPLPLTALALALAGCNQAPTTTDNAQVNAANAAEVNSAAFDDAAPLVENTADGGGDSFWAFRSVAEYQRLFRPIRLAHVHDYHDLDERISVLTGRA